MSSHAEIPPGFAPLQSGGPFIQHNGPLYLRHEGSVVQFGFRVARRHAGPTGLTPQRRWAPQARS